MVGFLIVEKKYVGLGAYAILILDFLLHEIKLRSEHKPDNCFISKNLSLSGLNVKENFCVYFFLVCNDETHKYIFSLANMSVSFLGFLFFFLLFQLFSSFHL
jgi:hypothetical protein